jgi:hypothetical protein
MGPKGCHAGGTVRFFSFRRAVAWAKQQRVAEVDEWKSMSVSYRARRQHRLRGKAAIAFGNA